MKKIWIVLPSAAAGIVIMLVAPAIFPQWFGRETDRQEIIRAYATESAKREQIAFGKRCTDLRGGLRKFLESEVGPVLRNRKSGRDWAAGVPDDLKQSLDNYREYVLMCSRLYDNGKDGELNGLRDLAFTKDVDKDFLTMVMQMKYGAPTMKCDAACADSHFQELKVRYDKILARLTAPN